MKTLAWSVLLLLSFVGAPQAHAQTALSAEALRSCAEAQVAECQYRLGRRLEKGDGMPRDLAAAKRWYEKAYSGGYAEAGQALLDLIREGEGPPQAAHAEPSAAAPVAAELPAVPASRPAVQEPHPRSAVAAAPADRAPPARGAPAPPSGRHETPVWSDALCTGKAGERGAAPCPVTLQGAVIEREGHHVVLGLLIRNRSAIRQHVSRDHMRASQGGRPVDVLDPEQSTRKGRIASGTARVLGFLGSVAADYTALGALGSMAGPSGEHIRRSLAATVLREGSEQLSSLVPEGRPDYFGSANLEPGQSKLGVIVVELQDATAPVRVELGVGGQTAAFELDVAPTP